MSKLLFKKTVKHLTEINLPLQPINQQIARCEMNIAQQGCIGQLESQTVTCYCTTDMCNHNLNATPNAAPNSFVPSGGVNNGVPGFVQFF
jgi:hypothetical protein